MSMCAGCTSCPQGFQLSEVRRHAIREQWLSISQSNCLS